MPLARGDVVRVRLPRADPGRGHVQSGPRWAVILHSDDSLNKVPVVIIVPGTSKQAALRFDHTVLISPTTSSGLDVSTVFIGFQVQAADLDWIDTPPKGHLDDADLSKVEDAVLDALGFDLPDD